MSESPLVITLIVVSVKAVFDLIFEVPTSHRTAPAPSTSTCGTGARQGTSGWVHVVPPPPWPRRYMRGMPAMHPKAHSSLGRRVEPPHGPTTQAVVRQPPDGPSRLWPVLHWHAREAPCRARAGGIGTVRRRAFGRVAPNAPNAAKRSASAVALPLVPSLLLILFTPLFPLCLQGTRGLLILFAREDKERPLSAPDLAPCAPRPLEAHAPCTLTRRPCPRVGRQTTSFIDNSIEAGTLLSPGVGKYSTAYAHARGGRWWRRC